MVFDMDKYPEYIIEDSDIDGLGFITDIGQSQKLFSKWQHLFLEPIPTCTLNYFF